MRLDNTTLKLFGKFPREVGNPARSVVHNIQEFRNFIISNCGTNDCYSALFPNTGKIDKISFDSDGHGALGETKILYKALKEKKYKVIPVVSGKKGYHIHIILYPDIYDEPKKLLLNATLRILEDVFGVNDRNELNCKTFDSHIFGDVRRIFRIPNTLRPPENRNWCTYLPPDEFLTMTEADIALHMKSTHTYEYIGEVYPSLLSFPATTIKGTNYNLIKSSSEIKVRVRTSVLKNFLRPCLYNQIISINPRHDVRVASTVDLLKFFSPSDIFKFYGALEWRDWNPEKVEYQIGTCKNLRPFSCTTLRKKGIPRECCVG